MVNFRRGCSEAFSHYRHNSIVVHLYIIEPNTTFLIISLMPNKEAQECEK